MQPSALVRVGVRFQLFESGGIAVFITGTYSVEHCRITFFDLPRKGEKGIFMDIRIDDKTGSI